MDQIQVLASGRDADALRVAGVKQHRRPNAELLEEFPNWLVATTSTELPDVAKWVKLANKHHRLRGLLIHQPADLQFATSMLRRAGLRTLEHTLVHHDLGVLRRVIEAWAAGAQDRLIADATVLNGTLFVQTCGLELLEVATKDLRALRRLAPADASNLEVDEDGSFIYWPNADAHVDVDMIRVSVDSKYAERLRAESLVYDRALGDAIRRVRDARGLRQSDVPELSARQVGRIERGEVRPRLASLRLLAQAHHMSTNDYLDAVAEERDREDL